MIELLSSIFIGVLELELLLSFSFLLMNHLETTCRRLERWLCFVFKDSKSSLIIQIIFRILFFLFSLESFSRSKLQYGIRALFRKIRDRLIKILFFPYSHLLDFVFFDSVQQWWMQKSHRQRIMSPANMLAIHELDLPLKINYLHTTFIILIPLEEALSPTSSPEPITCLRVD